MNTKDNLALVQNYMNTVAGGDLEGALQLVWDDAEFQGPDGTRMTKNDLRGLFKTIAPLMVNPFEQTILGTTCEGNRVAVESTGKTKLANGKVYSNVYHFLFEIRDGKIAKSHEYCNTRAIEAFS